MPVMHKPLALAALCLAAGLCVPGQGQAQNYIGGANVVVNLRALDQLGPGPSAGSPYSTYPQAQPGFSAGDSGLKPLLGDSGGNVKLRPPRPSRGAVASTASAAPLVKSESVDASRPRSRAERPAQTAAASPPPVTITLPPPVAPAPGPAPVAGRPLALPSAQPPSAQPSSAQPPVQAAPQAPVATAALPQATSAPPAAPAPAPVAAPVTAPAPAPAPAPAASNPATQQSALLAPPPVAARAAGDLVMTFEAGKSELPGAASPQLEALAKQLSGNEERVQIRAYASANGADAASGARRLSLSRALAVRTYLIDRGVRSTRIDVRALGAPTDGSPADRVEVATIGR